MDQRTARSRARIVSRFERGAWVRKNASGDGPFVPDPNMTPMPVESPYPGAPSFGAMGPFAAAEPTPPPSVSASSPDSSNHRLSNVMAQLLEGRRRQMVERVFERIIGDADQAAPAGGR